MTLVKPYKIIHQSGKRTTVICVEKESLEQCTRDVAKIVFRDKEVEVYDGQTQKHNDEQEI